MAIAPISRTERRRLWEQFERARRGLAGPPAEWHAALRALCSCLIDDPGNLLFATAYLDHLRMHGGILLDGLVRRIRDRFAWRRARAADDWPALLRLGPPLLAAEPSAADVLDGLAAAAGASDLWEVERFYLHRWLAAAPDDVATHRSAAKRLYVRGHFSEAAECWRVVRERCPADTAAEAALVELRPWLVATATERAGFAEGLTQVERQPTDAAAYVRLARAWSDAGWLGEAAQTLEHGLLATGPSHLLRDALEQLGRARAERQLACARRIAAADPSPANLRLVEVFEAGCGDTMERREPV